MKTLCFPQTLMEPVLAEVLPAGFGPLTLLHPSREALDDQTAVLAEAHQIELIFPGGEDAAVAAAPGETIETLRRWAAENAGQDLTGLLRRAPDIPFFDADASARIAAEIKSDRSASPAATSAQRLQRARLLLVMAQELDRSHRELATDFQRLEAQERRMMALLKGESATPGIGEPGYGPRPTATAPLHMLAARVEAWAQLALTAEDVWSPDPVVWFLTGSLEVLAYIQDQAEANVLLDRRLSRDALEGLNAWLCDPQSLPPTMAAPAESAGKSPGLSASPALHLTLIDLPGLSRDRWLRRLAGAAPANEAVPDRPAPAARVRIAYAALV